MVTGAGRTAVSHVFAGRFLRLALRAESKGNSLQARAFFLTAIQHDSTPRSLIEFGRALADENRLEDAVTMLGDGWQLAKRQADRRCQATCCRRLSLVYRQLGNAALAHRFLQHSAAAEMADWQSTESRFSFDQMMCESTFAVDAGEYRRAESLCRAALSGADRSERTAALRQLAAIALRTGDAPRAARQCLAAARCARDAADERTFAECLVDLGHIFSTLNRTAAARRCYRSAAVRFRNSEQHEAARDAESWIRETNSIARLMHSDPSAN